jgi:hypothetical protein
LPAAPVSYGNVESISEEEMKIYLYFLASDQLEGETCHRAVSTLRRSTLPATWRSGVETRRQHDQYDRSAAAVPHAI